MWKSSNGGRWHCLMLDPDYCYDCLFVSLLPHSYHCLMVSWYISKREKFQMAEKRSTEEQRLVWELEQAMDVELFMELQSNWPEDSPYHLMILHKMFWHAANEGWKEVEWTICQGCWLHMPQLNPEVGIPAIQLVGPQMTKEEFMEIYLQVYKLHRLPSCPPSKLAIWEEIMAKGLDNSYGKEDQTPEAATQSWLESSHSSRSRTPHRGDNNPVGWTLAMVQEAHQKVLSTASTLEKEIERLHHAQARSQSRTRSKSRDCHRPSGEGQKRRCHQVRFTDEPVSSQSADPKMPLGEEGSQGRGSDLEELLELKATVASFLWGSLETLDEEGEKMPPQPDTADFSQWVKWKSERCETPDWWEELLAVLGKEDARRLAREVRPSFTLPQWMWELDSREATLQALLHHHVSAERSLCPWLTPSLHAGTSERFWGKRWWHTPGPSSIGQSRTTHLLGVSPTY